MCTKWGIRQDPDGRWIAHLVDILRLKVELPDVEAAIKAQDKIDDPALIILDERGVGLGVYQRLWRAGYEHLTGSTATNQGMETQDSKGLRPSLSKVERFGQAALVISDGRVFIPEQAPWLEMFLYEVAAFPNIAEKDQVDSDDAIRRQLRQGHQARSPQHCARSLTRSVVQFDSGLGRVHALERLVGLGARHATRESREAERRLERSGLKLLEHRLHVYVEFLAEVVRTAENVTAGGMIDDLHQPRLQLLTERERE